MNSPPVSYHSKRHDAAPGNALTQDRTYAHTWTEQHNRQMPQEDDTRTHVRVNVSFTYSVSGELPCTLSRVVSTTLQDLHNTLLVRGESSDLTDDSADILDAVRLLSALRRTRSFRALSDDETLHIDDADTIRRETHTFTVCLENKCSTTHARTERHAVWINDAHVVRH